LGNQGGACLLVFELGRATTHVDIAGFTIAPSGAPPTPDFAAAPLDVDNTFTISVTVTGAQ